MRKLTTLAATVLVAGAFVAGMLLLAWRLTAEDSKGPVVWPAKNLKWVDNPAVKGLKVAVLWGDPAHGAYGALKQVPGGTEFGLHTHSQDQKTLVVSGVIAFSMGTGARQDLTPGSYAFMPAGVAHWAMCKGGADCVYFEEQPGPSDYLKATKP